MIGYPTSTASIYLYLKPHSPNRGHTNPIGVLLFESTRVLPQCGALASFFCVVRRVFNGRCKLVLAARGCTHTVLYQPRFEYHWPIDFVRNSIYRSHVPPEINPSLVQVNTIQLTVTSPHLMIYRECRKRDHELPGRAPSAPPPIFDALLYRSGDAHQVNGEIRTYLSRQGRS